MGEQTLDRRVVSRASPLVRPVLPRSGGSRLSLESHFGPSHIGGPVAAVVSVYAAASRSGISFRSGIYEWS